MLYLYVIHFKNIFQNDNLMRKLNLKEEEILNLRERLKYTEKSNVSETQQQSVSFKVNLMYNFICVGK